MTNIALTDLVGLHTLRGIARDIIQRGEDRHGEEPAQRVVILLDDSVFVFFEDTQDGYRSDLHSIERHDSVSFYLTEHEDVSISPIDPPLVVEIRHRAIPEHNGDGASAIYMINERTGLVVFDIGTDNIDDYYPSFVFQWNPEGWTPKWLESEESP